MRQTLPVVKKGSRNQIIDASILRSPLWNPTNWVIHEFKTNMRVMSLVEQGFDGSKQQEFAEWLLKVGDGIGGSLLELPPNLVSNSQEPHDLISSIYGNLSDSNNLHPSILKGKCIITPRNDMVKILNEKMIDLVSGTEFVYHAANEVR